MSAPVAEDKLPWLILRLIPEMTRVRFYTLIGHFQNPSRVLRAQAREIEALRGFDGDLARRILQARQTAELKLELEQELELMARHSVRLLTIDDEEYPDNLRQSSFAPPMLYVRGRLEPCDRYSVAIVGSRQATQYGKAVAQQFAGRLARSGITVVSGFARGIDSWAHASALQAGGRTLGVLGNGLAVCYPAENSRLAERIVEQGALISEYPMRTSPDRYNFPERNQIIAAISLGTLVVEAAEKSGALITANDAVEENRFVFAVPGDINRLTSRGTNNLIHSGARLVQSADDILSEMSQLLRGYLRQQPEDAPQPDAEGPAAQPALPSLSREETLILDLIRREPQYFDVLASSMDPEQIPVHKLSSILLGLELKQLVKQLPGRLYTVLN